MRGAERAEPEGAESEGAEAGGRWPRRIVPLAMPCMTFWPHTRTVVELTTEGGTVPVPLSLVAPLGRTVGERLGVRRE